MTTENDRELLKLAAEAAGDPIEGWTADDDSVPVAILRSGAFWQPILKNRLTDCMGDALRLAVKLHFKVNTPADKDDDAVVWGYEDEKRPLSYSDYADPYVATRCAIVRAAAEVNKVSLNVRIHLNSRSGKTIVMTFNDIKRGLAIVGTYTAILFAGYLWATYTPAKTCTPSLIGSVKN